MSRDGAQWNRRPRIHFGLAGNRWQCGAVALLLLLVWPCVGLAQTGLTPLVISQVEEGSAEPTPEKPPADPPPGISTVPVGEPAAAAAPASATNGGEGLGASQIPATASTPTSDSKPPARVYLPFRVLDRVFEEQGASVVIRLADYLKLIDRWMTPPLRDPGLPSVAGVVNQAKYEARIAQDVAVIKATLSVRGLTPGWSEIPLRFGAAAISKMQAEPATVLLRGLGDGNYTLLIPDQGDYVVQLELTARVRTSPEGRQLEFEMPAVGLTSLELLVPESGQEFELQPPRVPLVSAGDGGSTKLSTELGATDRVQVTWRAKAGHEPEMDLLANVQNLTAVTVENGLVHTDTWLTFDALRGRMERVQIAIPADQRILDVNASAKLRQWQVLAPGAEGAIDAGGPVLDVEFLTPVTGQVTVEVHCEKVLPAEAFDVGGMEPGVNGGKPIIRGIHALGVLREGGQLAVRGSEEITLSIEQQTGVSRMDEGEVDPRLRRPGSVYFKNYSPGFRLRVEARPVQPRLLLTHRARAVFREDQLKLTTELQYDIERAGLFELQFKLPVDFQVEQVICEGLKQFDISADGRLLAIQLQERRSGRFLVQVVGSRKLVAGSETPEQTLPLLEPIGVEIENGFLAIYSSPALEVLTNQEATIGMLPDPSGLTASEAGVQPVSAWQFNRRPAELVVRTLRRPPRLSAQVATRIEAKPGLVQVRARLNYRVEYSGLDTLAFSVPEAVADSIQIQSDAGGSQPPIKQRSRVAAAENGWVTWTVVTQRDVLGEYPLVVTYDVTPTIGEASRGEQSVLGLPRVLDTPGVAGRPAVSLAEINGEATVLKDRTLAVTVAATGGEAEAIDVRELRWLEQTGVTAFRYYRQPVELTVVTNRYEIEPVVETVVSRRLIESVVDKSGTVTIRARYRLQSSQRQRLPLELPKSISLLGVFVDRKAVALEEDPEPAKSPSHTAFLLNVARSKSADEPFSLMILYRYELAPKPFLSSSGQMLLRLPILGGRQREQVAVQQTRAAVWIPKEYSLVGQPEGFVVESRRRFSELVVGGSPASIDQGQLEQWIGLDSAGIFEFPREGRGMLYSSLGDRSEITVTWWYLPFFTAIVSGALVLIALVLRPTGWENRLTVLIVVGFLAAAYALVDRELVIHGLATAVYGLVAMVAIWVISSLLGWRKWLTRQLASPTGSAASAAPAVSGSVPTALASPIASAPASSAATGVSAEPSGTMGSSQSAPVAPPPAAPPDAPPPAN